MKNHTHRIKTSAERGWTGCVTPDKCADMPQCASAHGNIVIVDTCSCGAVRMTEKNGKASNRGQWIEAA
jgi:hypothetical protein